MTQNMPATRDLLNRLTRPTESVFGGFGLDEPDAQNLLDAYRQEVLAERAMAVAWSQWDESVPPRRRVLSDMQELTAVADPDHRARRTVRTSCDLDALAAEARVAAIREYAQKIRDDTGLIEGLDDACCRSYGNALARWMDSQADSLEAEHAADPATTTPEAWPCPPSASTKEQQ